MCCLHHVLSLRSDVIVLQSASRLTEPVLSFAVSVLQQASEHPFGTARRRHPTARQNWASATHTHRHTLRLLKFIKVYFPVYRLDEQIAAQQGMSQNKTWICLVACHNRNLRKQNREKLQ